MQEKQFLSVEVIKAMERKDIEELLRTGIENPEFAFATMQRYCELSLPAIGRAFGKDHDYYKEYEEAVIGNSPWGTYRALNRRIKALEQTEQMAENRYWDNFPLEEGYEGLDRLEVVESLIPGFKKSLETLEGYLMENHSESVREQDLPQLKGDK